MPGAMPAEWCWQHFKDYGVPWSATDAHHVARCNACVEHHKSTLCKQDAAKLAAGQLDRVRTEEELDAAADTEIPKINGRGDRMTNHLKTCKYVHPEIKGIAKAGNPTGTTVRLSRGQQLARAAVILPNIDPALSLMYPPSPAPSHAVTPPSEALTPTGLPMWPPEKQEEFYDDLCRLFVACNWAWNGVANPELLLFMSRYISQAKIPDRRVLSGRVLDRLVAQFEEKVRVEVSGKLATGQCDGWKSLSKAHIISTSSTVAGKLHLTGAHDVSPERKTADNLLQIVTADMQMCKDRYGMDFIGYCSDDGGDSRGMCRRLGRVNPRLLIFPCLSHQLYLTTGRMLKLDIPSMRSLDTGLEIIKWISNHSRALGMLKEQQKLTEEYKKNPRLLTLIFQVISRWTSHFLAARRLLVLSGPLRALYLQSHQSLVECAGNRRDAVERAEEVLAPIDDSNLWKNLTEAKTLLEPFAIATKCSQSVDWSLDDALLTFANLYRIFNPTDVNRRVSNCVHSDLEKRFGAINCEAMIVTLWLNPFLRSAAFSPTNLAVLPISVYAMAAKLFKQFFGEAPDLDFHAAFFDYSAKPPRGEFRPEFMQLEIQKALFEREKKRVSIRKIWEALDTGIVNGRNGLVRLAIALHSFVPTSAGSERGFSRFGLLLTKLRTQLSIDKVRKMTTLNMAMREEHEALGMKTDRVKRRFQELTEEHDDADTHPERRDGPDTFAGLATQIIKAVDDDDTIDSDDDDIPVPAPDEPAPPYAPSALTLKSLFNWPQSARDSEDAELVNSLGFYWTAGVTALEDELAVHELLMEDMHL
ncbi:ribonuclease H-like domain-containing protein [Mycena pura]|uniref:Ribonuclease H-like domain-containing protein n=1 Tax=Mycena pura TaxID=153505 RepID=A0AAD6VPK1_9AGAR|nr:ribonuclease H-like domain-containing protein [Mycena pura]